MLFIVILKMVADSGEIITKKFVKQKINIDNQQVRIFIPTLIQNSELNRIFSQRINR